MIDRGDGVEGIWNNMKELMGVAEQIVVQNKRDEGKCK